MQQSVENKDNKQNQQEIEAEDHPTARKLIDEGKPVDGAPTGARKSKSDPIQLTFKEVFITANPVQKKCCKGKGPPAEPKLIINGVSGTVLPGQFVSIIGASGKLIRTIKCLVQMILQLLTNFLFFLRCW